MKGNKVPLIVLQVNNIFSVNTINIIVTIDCISAEFKMRRARQNEVALRAKILSSHGHWCAVSSHYKSPQLPHFGSSAMCWTLLHEEHSLNSPILKIGILFIVVGRLFKDAFSSVTIYVGL
jgi:hypothetical protein